MLKSIKNFYFLLGLAALLFGKYNIYTRDLFFALTSGLLLSMVGMIIEQHITKAKSSVINYLYLAFSLCFIFWVLSASLYI